MEFIWLHNQHPEEGSELADRIKEVAIPEQNRFSYVAAEYSTVKAIRSYLRSEKGFSNQEFYAYSYWKAGVAEDQSAKDRKVEKES